MIPVTEIIKIVDLEDALKRLLPHDLLCLGVDLTDQSSVKLVYNQIEDDRVTRLGVVLVDFDPTRFAYFGYAGHTKASKYNEWVSLIEYDVRLSGDVLGSVAEILRHYLSAHASNESNNGFADVVLITRGTEKYPMRAVCMRPQGPYEIADSVKSVRLAPDGALLGVRNARELVMRSSRAGMEEGWNLGYTFSKPVRFFDRVRLVDGKANLVVSTAGEVCSRLSLESINGGCDCIVRCTEETVLNTHGQGVFGGVVSEPNGHYFIVVSFVMGMPRVSFVPRPSIGTLPRSLVPTPQTT